MAEIQKVVYSNPAIEGFIAKTHEELTARAEIQGQHDGLAHRPKTVSEHSALFLNLLQSKWQIAIDVVRQELMPTSGVAYAKTVSDGADVRIVAMKAMLHNLEYPLLTLTKQADALKPSMRHREQRTWANYAVILIAIFEGCMSYGFFRRMLPLVAAVVACMGVAAAVGYGAHYCGGYVKAAATSKEKVKRYILCLLPTIVVFTVLGFARAAAFSHHADVSVHAHQPHPGFSYAAALGLSLVSIIIYALGLFIASIFFRTKAEEEQEQAYGDKCKEVAAVQLEIASLKDEMAAIDAARVVAIQNAHLQWEHGVLAERRIVSFCYEIAELYKAKNQLFRQDGIPAFFSQRPIFEFTLFFNTQGYRPYGDTAANPYNTQTYSEQSKNTTYEIH